MSMREARMFFRVRSNNTKVKMNQRSDAENARKLWKCSECGYTDSRSHIVWCPFFADLREGKSLASDRDLVKYFIQVLKIREDRSNREN